MGPEAVDVVELHDAAAPAELIHYENLGLCASGYAPKLIRSGDTDIGGRISVNPSGGLLSRGHPVGATGVAQLVELTQQVRGTAGAPQLPAEEGPPPAKKCGNRRPPTALGGVALLSINLPPPRPPPL